MEYLADYGLFLAKSVTLLAAALILLSALVMAVGAAAHGRRALPVGHLVTRRLNDVLDNMHDELCAVALDAKALKKLRKDREKASKQSRKHAGQNEQKRCRTWVLRFNGDLAATAVQALRNEVTAILTLAEAGDEVVACVESPGGVVHGYGLAASQLHRIRAHEGLALVVAVDKVAASGGYMMACIGERILAAPFAQIGSIGVIAQVPNIHRLLKRHDVEVEEFTAGEFKRTLTIFGENTDKGREKFGEEIEDVHRLFKAHVAEHRPGLDLERVATGETWYGRQALGLGLVDELTTSDEYLVRACEERDVFEVKWIEPRSHLDRLLQRGADALLGAAERGLLRWRERHNWIG